MTSLSLVTDQLGSCEHLSLPGFPNNRGADSPQCVPLSWNLMTAWGEFGKETMSEELVGSIKNDPVDRPAGFTMAVPISLANIG